jgi:Flp pilus assembly secretin CpaC
MGAGNDQKVNAATQVIDPWRRNVGNSRIPGNGDRMVNAVKQYRAPVGTGAGGGQTGQPGAGPGGANNTGGLISGPRTTIGGTLPATVTSPFGTILSNLVNRGGVSIDVLITALETQGTVRKLAEPNLMALSGDTAKFPPLHYWLGH